MRTNLSKNFLIFSYVLLLLVFFFFFCYASFFKKSSNLKVGIVDLGKVFTVSQIGKMALQDKLNSLKPSLEKLRGEKKSLNNKVEKFTDKANLVMKKESESKIEESRLEQQKEKLIDERKILVNKLVAFEKNKDKMENDFLNSFNSKLRNAISEVAKSEGLNLVLPESSVSYSGSTFDVTDKVIQYLDKEKKVNT